MKHILPHLRYLRYVLIHKWFVFRACLWLRVPLWQALIHDWTKFTPAEWGPYVRRFYAGRGSQWNSDADPAEFHAAWHHHWTHNPHHHEYWVVVDLDRRIKEPLAMPERYVREMVADWYGAGMAQRKPDIRGWYAAHKDKRQLHPRTTARVEALLDQLPRS